MFGTEGKGYSRQSLVRSRRRVQGTDLMGSQSLFFYDDLRASLTLLDSTNSVTTAPGSAIYQVGQEGTAVVRLAHIVSMLSLSDGAGGETSQEALNSLKAAAMAVSHFNSQDPVIVADLKSQLTNSKGEVCNIKLTMDVLDTENSPQTGARLLAMGVQRLGFPYETTVAVSGDRPEITLPLAVINGASLTPHLSSSFSSSTITRSPSTPFYGNLYPSSETIASITIDYLHEVLDIKLVGFLFYENSFGSERREAFESAAGMAGIQTRTAAVNAAEDLDGALLMLKESEYKYIVTTAGLDDIKDLVNSASRAGIMGPDYFWLVVGDLTPSDIFDLEFLPNSNEAKAISGMGVLSIRSLETRGMLQRFYAAWDGFDADPELLPYLSSKYSLVDNTTRFSLPGIGETNTYDSVVAFGLAMCQSQVQFPLGADIFDSLGDTKFIGASGSFAFEVERGVRGRNTTHFMGHNVILGKDGKVDISTSMVYTTCTAGPEICSPFTPNMWHVIKPFVYADMTTTPPMDFPPLDVEYALISTPLYATITGISFFLMLSSVTFAIWTWRNRSNPVIKSSQPGFLIVICVGVFFIGATGVVSGTQTPRFPYELADAACMVTYWFFFIGFSLAFGALFAKTWRINKILRQDQFRRVVVQSKDVILPGILLFLANVAVLTVWQIFAPLTYNIEIEEGRTSSQDMYGRGNRGAGDFCIPEEGAPSDAYFFLPLFIIDITAVIAANVQVFRARHITTEFSESRYVAISMLVILQACVLAVPLFFYPVDADVSYLGRAILALIIGAAILFLIFVPKIMFWRKRERILKEREAKRRSRLSVLPPGSIAREIFGGESFADGSSVVSSSPAGHIRETPMSSSDGQSGLRVTISSRISSQHLDVSGEDRYSSRASMPEEVGDCVDDDDEGEKSTQGTSDPRSDQGRNTPTGSET